MKVTEVLKGESSLTFIWVNWQSSERTQQYLVPTDSEEDSHPHLMASRRAPRSLSVVCFMSSKLLSNFTQDWKKRWTIQETGRRGKIIKMLLARPVKNPVVCVSVWEGEVSHITAPFRVSLPVFLLLLLAGRGYGLSMSLHPGVQSQDALCKRRQYTSIHQGNLLGDASR